MGSRPALVPGIPPALFAEHYWLRSELAAFCRTMELAAQGLKMTLAARIQVFPNGQQLEEPPTPRRSAAMPSAFTRFSVIEAGWRFSQPRRAWFELELGEPFRFDGILREDIHGGAGRTLGEVLDDWRAKRSSKIVTEIGPQFD